MLYNVSRRSEFFSDAPYAIIFLSYKPPPAAWSFAVPSYDPLAETNRRHEKNARRINRALERFPFMPDDALIDLKITSALLGDRSRASIYRDIARGDLPRPIKIGGTSLLPAGSVRALMRGGDHE
jgi:predicted DNA-binding transcriptional regulator AlpA